MRQSYTKNKHNPWQESVMTPFLKTFVQGGLFLIASLTSTFTLAYTAVENTALKADGIRTLSIRTYSGPLSITSNDGDSIEVEVVIDFGDAWDEDESRRALAEGLVFTLERRGSRAELNSWVGDYDDGDFSFFTWGLIDLFRSGKPRPFSHLEVKVPDGMNLEINDFRGEVIIAGYTGDVELLAGAGSVEITDLTGNLDLQDGSGNILVNGISGNVEIRDGSGNIDVRRIGGRLTIHDGSGNIEVFTVGDDVDIRDGSGNIRVTDLARDAEIHDGSGNITVRKVGGTLSLTDGSGGIDVSDVGKDVIVHNSGSGRFDVSNVQGEVIDSVRGRRRDDASNDYNYDYRYRYRDRDRDIDIDIDEDIDVDVDVDVR